MVSGIRCQHVGKWDPPGETAEHDRPPAPERQTNVCPLDARCVMLLAPSGSISQLICSLLPVVLPLSGLSNRGDAFHAHRFCKLPMLHSLLPVPRPQCNIASENMTSGMVVVLWKESSQHLFFGGARAAEPIFIIFLFYLPMLLTC